MFQQSGDESEKKLQEQDIEMNVAAVKDHRLISVDPTATLLTQGGPSNTFVDQKA